MGLHPILFVNEAEKAEVTVALTTVLKRTIEQQGSDLKIADAVCDLWAHMDDVARPIFGQSFVAAILDYCLKQERADHPWTEPSVQPGSLDLAQLREAIVREPPSTAASTAFSALDRFQAILVQLLGQEMKDRLIQAVADAMARTGRNVETETTRPVVHPGCGDRKPV